MPYLDTNARTVRPTSNEQFQTLGRMPSLFGVFIGFVMRADDVQRNGRLQVWVPEFGTARDEEQGWFTVNYCSPFAGATNVNTISKDDIESFEGTQTSYGMWMIPPDINNQVLVMFVGGDSSRGIWLGSLYNQFMNNMVPGMASDTKSYQHPGIPVPVAEYNKWDTKVTQPDRAFKPFEKTKFKGVGNQGLITDKVRGLTNSSARRESPSHVYGILTPGPPINPNAAPKDIRRKGGSSFIMDDGKCSEYVELATKSGAKMRLDETHGIVYFINRDGTSWMQMDEEGNVDVFSAKNISFRAQRDFNIRADRNINIEAGQNIFMKAAMDTVEATTEFTYDVNNEPITKSIPVWKYVGEGAGEGGNIAMQAFHNWHSTSQKNAFITVVENNLDLRVQNSFMLTTTDGGQDFNSKKGIKLTTGAALDLAAQGNIRVGTNGLLSVTSEGDLILCTSAKLSQTSAADMIITAGGKMSLDATEVHIDTDVFMPSLDVGEIKANTADVGMIKATTTDTGVINSTTLAIPNLPLGSGSPAAPEAPVPAEPLEPIDVQLPVSAIVSMKAEVKPLNDKINVLAVWADPETKFKRESESIATTVSRFPTYEPCPEHKGFTPAAIAGGSPKLTEADKTYEGSGAAGNTATSPAKPSTAPGAENKEISGDPAADSAPAKDFNEAAFDCQIKKHEGVSYKSYTDATGLSAGVGHFLREDEKEKYPLGTPVSEEQVDRWFQEDKKTAIKIAQTLTGDSWNDLSDERKRAMVDLSYNLGQPRLSKFKNFRDAMDKKDYDRAAAELKNSKWYTQVGKRGPNIVSMIANSTDPTGCGDTTSA